jgi:hypothetical protein
MCIELAFAMPFFCVWSPRLVGFVGEWVLGKVGLSMGGSECLVKVHGWGALVSVKGCNLFIYLFVRNFPWHPIGIFITRDKRKISGNVLKNEMHARMSIAFFRENIEVSLDSWFDDVYKDLECVLALMEFNNCHCNCTDSSFVYNACHNKLRMTPPKGLSQRIFFVTCYVIWFSLKLCFLCYLILPKIVHFDHSLKLVDYSLPSSIIPKCWFKRNFKVEAIKMKSCVYIFWVLGDVC